MLENLKVALRKQKKLLLVFFLTIFIPSLTLSIFGLRAIRNERFRLAEQVESEHRGMAELLKEKVAGRLDEIDASLRGLAGRPSFRNRTAADIEEQVSARLDGEPLLGEVFILYKDGPPLFPLFPSYDAAGAKSSPVLTSSQRSLLSEAEENEFRRNNPGKAAALYERLAASAGDDAFKAEMLAGSARCLMRLGSYDRAVEVYTRIQEDYPAAVSSSGLSLGLAAGLQILECCRQLNDPRKFMEAALTLYGDMLHKPWHLSRDTYNLFSAMVGKEIEEALDKAEDEAQPGAAETEWRELKDRHREYVARWEEVIRIEEEIVPSLRRMIESGMRNPDEALPRPLSMYEKGRLLLGSWILGEESGEPLGILAAEIDGEALRREILEPAVSEFLQGGEKNVVISSLQGADLAGTADPDFPLPTVTAFFDDNFPPWKIEFFRTGIESGGLRGLLQSFYFWTILTLILILTFGAVLISRTLSHEMEVLKIKSDFVSSVSHELKTPLTAIKALVERLKEGRVKDAGKMAEYYSIIANDTEKLSRLVRNILDFSKIEEGKKEYEFSETDVVRLVSQQLDEFRRDEVHKDVNLSVRLAEDLPLIQADGEALARAFNNLLNNAVKFSPEQPEIVVEAGLEDNQIRISVEDRGIGISGGEIDKIFDKFYQGRNAQGLTVTGTGLGLTLVRHIAEAHGGRVTAESEPGRGSTFSIFLPVGGKGK